MKLSELNEDVLQLIPPPLVHPIGSADYTKIPPFMAGGRPLGMNRLRDELEDELGIPHNNMLDVSMTAQLYRFTDGAILVWAPSASWSYLNMAVYKDGQIFTMPKAFITRYMEVRSDWEFRNKNAEMVPAVREMKNPDKIVHDVLKELWDEGKLKTRTRPAVVMI
jgi:hypothetical protein